jgi:hypothetical protein
MGQENGEHSCHPIRGISWKEIRSDEPDRTVEVSHGEAMYGSGIQPAEANPPKIAGKTERFVEIGLRKANGNGIRPGEACPPEVNGKTRPEEVVPLREVNGDSIRPGAVDPPKVNGKTVQPFEVAPRRQGKGSCIRPAKVNPPEINGKVEVDVNAVDVIDPPEIFGKSGRTEDVAMSTNRVKITPDKVSTMIQK